MAKRRLINTRFWSDTYISDLDPSEKLLFIYFLTNPYTNIAGAYEISIKQIALDTGFDKEMIEKIVKRFEADDKIYYRQGYVVIRNFIKHQEKNPKVVKGIENEVENLPDDIKNIVYDSLSHLNLNLNLNSNLNTNTKRESGSNEPTPFQEAKNFFSLSQNELLEWAVSYAEKKNLEPQTISEYALQFFSYWTEPNKSGKKQKWELEKTFEIKRRWANWLSNQAKWSKKGHINKQTPNFIL